MGLILSLSGAVVIALTSSAAPAASPACADVPTAIVERLPPRTRAKLAAALAASGERTEDAAAAGRLGVLLHALDQHEAAGACYDRARQLAPHTFAWAYLSGVVHAELGAYGAAIAALRRAREIDDAYLPAGLRMADVLLAANRIDESEVEYRRVLRRYPELALAHYGTARVLAAKADATAALQEYEAAVRLAPAFGAAHYALSLAYRNAGRADLAARHMAAFEQSRGRKPSPADPVMDEVRANRDTARELIARGAEAGRAGQLDASIRLHLDALAADPGAARAHVNLISLYARAGRADLAEQHYREALRLGSDLAEAHYNFGVLLASASRQAEANAAFLRALEVDPFHARAHNNVAAVLAREGRRTEAVEHYRQALASDPQYVTARLGLARALADLGRSAEAAEEFRKAAELQARGR